MCYFCSWYIFILYWEKMEMQMKNSLKSLKLVLFKEFNEQYL